MLSTCCGQHRDRDLTTPVKRCNCCGMNEETLREILYELAEKYRQAYLRDAEPYIKALQSIIANRPPPLMVFDDRVDIGLDTKSR